MQPTKDMISIIKTVKPNERLKLVFADKTFEGDLSGRIFHILAMHLDGMIKFDEEEKWDLQEVATSGRWDSCRTYTITVLEKFNPEYLIDRTIGHGLLEEVTLLN